MQTHVSDVVNTIEAEELRDAVLVGHSYGGMVITGAADRLADRLIHLIYLEAVVPHPGESWSSGHTAQTQAARRDMIAASGSSLPPDPRIVGLAGSDHAWVARCQTAKPGGVYDDPLHFDAYRVAAIRRTFIDCTSPALPTIALARERVRTEPGWEVVEIATGHNIMISAPQPLVAALLASRTG